MADFDQGFCDQWQRRYGYAAPVNPARTNFYIRDDVPPEYHVHVVETYSAPGFFLSLPPKAGALEAAQALLATGHDVRICTSPINEYRHCVGEKIAWVEHYLGREWASRVILTRDKTWVRGDILIDDKPDITGSLQPYWQHWIYDMPHNRHIDAPHRVDWEKRESWQILLDTDTQFYSESDSKQDG